MVDATDPVEEAALIVDPPAPDRRARRRARAVTYGLVAGMFVAAQLHVEQWPVTSFQLFSHVRTDRTSGLELVAVDHDGGRRPIRLGAQAHRVGNPSHQLALLRDDPPEEQRATVVAWLALVHVDPRDVDRVLLERVERRLDADGGPAEELRRTVVAEIDL